MFEGSNFPRTTGSSAAGRTLPRRLQKNPTENSRTANAVSSCSCNAATPTNLLPSVIMSVVHDHAAPVAQYLGAIDSSRYNPVIRVFCQRLLAAGKAKKVALVACMRKLLNTLNSVVKSGRHWDLQATTP